MLCFTQGTGNNPVCSTSDCTNSVTQLGYVTRNSPIRIRDISNESNNLMNHNDDETRQHDEKLREANVKSTKRTVNFSGVTVYSFAREQGFSSVPDTGWCSLGMAQQHFSVSRYDIHHHQLLLRLRRKRLRMLARRSRMMGATTSLSARLRRAQTAAAQIALCEENSLHSGDTSRVPNFPSPPPLSPQYVQDRPPTCDVTSMSENPRFASAQATPPPPCLSPPSPRRVLANLDESLFNSVSFVNSEGLDTDSETSLDQMPAVNRPKATHSLRSRRKLLPVNANARIRLLRESGVLRLDESEREVCLRMRATRSRVGCECGPRYPCVPGRCSCVEDGVQCQVDRASFPCSCIAEQCHNPNGRTEFPQEEVKAHIQRVLKQMNEETTGRATHSSCLPEPHPAGDGPTSSVFPAGRTTAVNKAGEQRERIRFVSPLRVYRKPRDQTPMKDRRKSKAPTMVDPTGATMVVSLSALELPTETTRYSVSNPPPTVVASTPANPSSDPPRHILFPDSEFTTPAAVCDDEVPPSGLFPVTIDTLPPCDLLSSQPLDFGIFAQTRTVAPSSTMAPNLQIVPGPQDSQSRNYCLTSSPRSSSNHDPLSEQHIQDSNSLLEDEGIQLTTDKVTVAPNLIIDTEVADQLSFEAGVLLRPEDLEQITDQHRSDVQLEYHSSPTTPMKAIEHPLSPDNSRSKQKSNRWRSPSVAQYPSQSSFINRFRKAPFVSKSAPSSPNQITPASLGRLSLRRRAIPRLPVTPSGRTPQSARTPNIRTVGKKQVFRCTPSNFKQRLFEDTNNTIDSTPVPLSPLVRLNRPAAIDSSPPHQSPTRAPMITLTFENAVDTECATATASTSSSKPV